MKQQILKAEFKVFSENVDTTMRNLKEFCESTGVIYTYSIKNRFWPMKTIVKAEFEGPEESVERIERYLQNAHGVS